MKRFVIVLTVLVVVAVLAVFYGAVSPPAAPGRARAGVDRVLGWLVPERTLGFEELAHAPCADRSRAALVVEALTTCSVAVPSPAEVVLCSEDPNTVQVITDGRDYPPQRVDGADLSCAAPQRIPLYDQETALTLACLAGPGEVCLVEVRGADG